MTEPNLIACKCTGKMLDVGCGKHPFNPNADGIDMVDYGQLYVQDIEEFWKIPDDTYDCVHAYNILEHITNKLGVLNEMWRVLKQGGVAEIVVPDSASSMDMAMADPTHKSLWVKGTFYHYLCGNRPSGAEYDMRKWEMVECRNFSEINDNIIFCRIKKPYEKT